MIRPIGHRVRWYRTERRRLFAEVAAAKAELQWTQPLGDKARRLSVEAERCGHAWRSLHRRALAQSPRRWMAPDASHLERSTGDMVRIMPPLLCSG